MCGSYVVCEVILADEYGAAARMARNTGACVYLTCKALDLEGGGDEGPQLELHGGVAPHREVGEGGGRQQRQISQPLPFLRDRLMQLLRTDLPAAPASAAYARSALTLVRALAYAHATRRGRCEPCNK